MIDRHPFPGPGLGVRILGEVKKEFADTLRRADDIFISELRSHDLYQQVSQAFAVFLPVKSRNRRRAALCTCNQFACCRDHRLHDRKLGTSAA